MDEYVKINWRESLLENFDEDHITLEDLRNSKTSLFLQGKLNCQDIRKSISKDCNECTVKIKQPGQNYNLASVGKSFLTPEEHGKLMNAYKLIHSGRTALNKYEKQDIEFYNNIKARVLQENQRFLKEAEKWWNTKHLIKPMEINKVLYNYGMKDRLRKLTEIFKIPKVYKPVDLLPWSSLETDIKVELQHTLNVLDLGSVGKYLPPLLKEACFLDRNLLPEIKPTNYFFKLPISQDENINDFLRSEKVDVAISMSALKCLLDFHANDQNWIIPVVIKHVDVNNGSSISNQRVFFIDKPLPKLTVTNQDLNEKCHKLLIKSNFCKLEGFSYQSKGKLINETADSKEQKERILPNVAYKLWTLKQEDVPNAHMLKMSQSKSFRILVRSKLDGCHSVNNTLMPIVVAPTLEYQLNFGGRIATQSELVKNWTDLYFRPGSLLYKIRTHFNTSEVLKIDSYNMQKLVNEANQSYELKLQQNFTAFYKLLIALSGHQKDGCYLLRHEPKNGSFVALLAQEAENDVRSLDAFDLHQHYSNASVTEVFFKKWSKLDVECILPMHEMRSQCPGLFTPKPFKKQQKKGKKWKSKASIAKKSKKKQKPPNGSD